VRLAALTGAALLCWAAPAAAQGRDYAPAVGSGSFNAAPILQPGRYRDTVLPEEYLYYGIRVEPGRRLHVIARSEIDGQAFSDLNLSFVAVNVAAPDRRPLLSGIEGDASFSSADNPPADFTTPAATTVAGEEQGGSTAWDGPGVYFVSFYPTFAGSGEPPKAEIPFHFEIALEGTPETEPAATPVATSTPRPKASAAATPAPDGGGGASSALAAGFGAGGLLAGVLAGLALRRRQ
jgi:hypothetical protein